MSDAGSRAIDEQPEQPDSSYVVSPVPTKMAPPARAKSEERSCSPVFDVERMSRALEGPMYTVPMGLSREQRREFIASIGKTANESVWFAVSECLPEEDADVLCYWGNHTAMETGLWNGRRWQASGGGMEAFDAPPTHFAELPTPPATQDAKP